MIGTVCSIPDEAVTSKKKKSLTVNDTFVVWSFVVLKPK